MKQEANGICYSYGFYPLFLMYLTISSVLYATFGSYRSWAALSLIALLAPLGLLYCPLFRKVHAANSTAPLILLSACLCLFSLILGLTNSLMYCENPLSNRMINACGLCAFPLGIGILIALIRSKGRKHIFALRLLIILCAGMFLAGKVFVIFASPKPHIDVYYILQEATRALFAGENPYRATYTAIYPPGTYLPGLFYFPVTVALLAPFRWAFGDIRTCSIFFDLVCACMLYRIATVHGMARGDSYPKLAAPLLALVYLANPLSFFVLEQAWTEPISAGLLCVAIYLIYRGSQRAGTIVLGVFFAAKQYNLILLPFIFLLEGGGKKILVISMIVLITILPYLIASPRQFLYSTVMHHLKLGSRPDALSLESLLFNRYGTHIPPVISLPLILSLLILLLLIEDKNIAGFLRASITVSFCALLVLKNAFCNYYYLISAQMIFLMLLYLIPERSRCAYALSPDRVR
ncbi:MAG: hypothetical protein NTX71_06305 [Candidatus Aureabacteria bacterium]|nr:hypothetical protein [Candidatus Auribacterota bacterium]